MNQIYSLIAVLVMVFILGCTAVTQSDQMKPSDNNMEQEQSEDIDEPATSKEAADWMDTLLRDVNSGMKFRISDFNKPVLLESFAVWWPTCTKQQEAIKKLHDEIGDDIISISLDTDPNEDEEKVLEHTTENGFNWRYTVAPVEMTRSLIDDFGVKVVNAPSAPVILICDGTVELLRTGVKSSEELISTVNERCTL
jgi:hypothetical protein